MVLRLITVDPAQVACKDGMLTPYTQEIFESMQPFQASYGCMRKEESMTIRSLKTLSVLALVLSPALAFARPIQSSGVHQRPVLFHDRSARMHVDRGAVAHH